MRSLTAATRQAMLAQETGEVFLRLIDIAHPSIATMHFVDNRVDIVSNGITYQAFAFDLQIPDERDDEITRIQLAIDNVDLRVVEAVRSIDSPATFTIQIIRAAEPNVAVAGPYTCTLRNVTYNELTVGGELWPYEDITNEPFPAAAFTPNLFPALYGGHATTT
jgi:Domain of unknown function (DUF1833)